MCKCRYNTRSKMPYYHGFLTNTFVSDQGPPSSCTNGTCIKGNRHEEPVQQVPLGNIKYPAFLPLRQGGGSFVPRSMAEDRQLYYANGFAYVQNADPANRQSVPGNHTFGGNANGFAYVQNADPANRQFVQRNHTFGGNANGFAYVQNADPANRQSVPGNHTFGGNANGFAYVQNADPANRQFV